MVTLRRLLARLGCLCLRLAHVNRLEAREGDDPTATTLTAVVYIFRDGPQVPMLLAGMAHAYGAMHGVKVELEQSDETVH